MVIGNTLKDLFFPEKVPYEARPIGQEDEEPVEIASQKPHPKGRAPASRNPHEEYSPAGQEEGQEEIVTSSSFRSEQREYSRTFSEQFADFLENGQWPEPQGLGKSSSSNATAPEQAPSQVYGIGSTANSGSSASSGSSGSGGAPTPDPGSITPTPSPTNNATISVSSANGAVSGTTGSGFKVNASAGSNLSASDTTASGYKVWME